MPLLACAFVWTTPALPDDALPGQHAASDESQEPQTPEQKKLARNTVVLLAVVTGIALTGLLLVIIAVAARGLSRKMATLQTEAPPAPGSEPRPPELLPDEPALRSAAPPLDQPPPQPH